MDSLLSFLKTSVGGTGFSAQISVEVNTNGPVAPNETKPRRWYKRPDSLITIPFEGQPDAPTDLYGSFKRGLAITGDRACLGERKRVEGGGFPFKFLSYNEVHERVLNLGSGLRSLGLQTSDRVGIYSINRVDWTVSLVALFSQSFVAVPLYDTLGATAVEFILNNADVSTAIISKEKVKNLLEAASRTPGLKHIVVMDEVDEATKAAAVKLKVSLHTLADIEANGRSNRQPPCQPSSTDLAYIMYTSGTTGDPKGVMLTHRNVLATMAGLNEFGVDITPDDCYISYLPLAHSLETCVHLLMLMCGASVGFYQGDVRKLFDDIAELKPTLMAGVPRVYARVYDKIRQIVDKKGFFTRALFKVGLSAQTYWVKEGLRSWLLDQLLFSKMQSSLGGRIRIMATGGAPMPAYLMDFLKVVFGCPIIQGYGMTENAAACIATPIGYPISGPIGCPLGSNEFKLVSVEEMGYTVHDKPFPRGEVCIFGANVFQGYWKLPEETERTLSKDGWLLTGDIGRLEADGALTIIDRKKNIFKLSQGEYVAAEALENIYGQSKFVFQIWVYGNSYTTQLVAVVVPNAEVLLPYAKEHGFPDSTDFVALCKQDEVKKLIMDDLIAVGKEGKLKGFEMIKAIHLESQINNMGQGFTSENDCLTVTFKLKRNMLLKKYKDVITAMYKKLNEDPHFSE
mmetsp:Transcript_3518/g.5348  ORF Transcript_3518/g.5348 Transcript_3518/m.5348 type:complete len:683 (+) Transcript_3518:179-2227(+)|eukprot:CAMPEP_0184675592 /NCGR_PEP_ID=MMETSP0308-20130426/87872_1 /TAXON_ID=38269 /ORGANISM="Gloeochaete witrockiana, Strain SAG 46.84" /LENGTH=682 /DNA_ID=CAMNT_0027123309 /DNA_START=111 /DNA_END=2159 /DNA_ORIENTATION=-